VPDPEDSIRGALKYVAEHADVLDESAAHINNLVDNVRVLQRRLAGADENSQRIAGQVARLKIRVRELEAQLDGDASPDS
jgi:predicted nuclease with TOPRIM domain